MNAGFGSWLLGMSRDDSALGGMLGMAIGIFIVLAATTFGSALIYAISGFGFAVPRHRCFCCFSTRHGQFSSLSSSRREHRFWRNKSFLAGIQTHHSPISVRTPALLLPLSSTKPNGNVPE